MTCHPGTNSIWKNQARMILKMVITTESSSTPMTLRKWKRPMLCMTPCPFLLSKILRCLRTSVFRKLNLSYLQQSHLTKQHLNTDVCAWCGPTGRREVCSDVCVHRCYFCDNHTSLVKVSAPPRKTVFLPAPWFRFLKQCFLEGRSWAMPYSSQLKLPNV